MKVADYIIEFFIEKGIEHVFGYPGGMVTHLMEAFSKREDRIQAHLCYHEQAAAFAACSYAQAGNGVGVAYATSGPGATNMVTGICNAYYDSIPVIFLTGQVNTFEAKADYGIRQRGFQETDIVSMVKDVTKYAVYVKDASEIGYCLEKAYQMAIMGRRGPVLLDIPMNIQREDIDPDKLQRYNAQITKKNSSDYSVILQKLRESNRPCMILGAGLKSAPRELVEQFVTRVNIPVVTSMLAVDLLPQEMKLNYGFIGAYGSRIANFVVAKSDFVLVLGSRLDVRQVGGKREKFAPHAQILRVDIDENELEYHIREEEIDICADCTDAMQYIQQNYNSDKDTYISWHHVCDIIREKLSGYDKRIYNCFTEKLSRYIPEDLVITADVGQNQIWVAQSYAVKHGQQILFSGGHGSMGYSLPAAIGAFYATGRTVISFNGDGGIQMNIQELEFIRRERLPIKIIVFNNYALGMIRHFQEMYFERNYVQTVNGSGYEAPNFEGICKAYDIAYLRYDKVSLVSDEFMRTEGPVLIEVCLREDTYVFPKLEFGKPNQDQEPPISRSLFSELMAL